MKNLSKIRTMFAIAVLAIAIGLTFATGNPLMGLAVVFMGSFGFAATKSNVLGFNAQFIDSSQLTNDSFLITAVKKSYGWTWDNSSNNWIKGENAEAIPSFDELKMKSRQAGIESRIFLTDKKTDLHTKPATGGYTNFTDNSIKPNQMFVCVGVMLRGASGVVGAALSALDFDVTTDMNVNNGKYSLTVNDIKVLDELPVETYFNSIGEIKSYFRLPQVKVLRPGSKWEAVLNIATVPAGYWVEHTLVGYFIETQAVNS